MLEFLQVTGTISTTITRNHGQAELPFYSFTIVTKWGNVQRAGAISFAWQTEVFGKDGTPINDGPFGFNEFAPLSGQTSERNGWRNARQAHDAVIALIMA